MADFGAFSVPYKTGVAADIGALPVASPAFTGTLTGPDITTTGNTILGNASTDTLNVGNGGLVKDASGNVGIGTVSPTAGGGYTPKLHLYGSNAALVVQGSGGSNYQIGTAGTAGGWLSIFDNTANAERVRIDPAGQILVQTAGKGISIKEGANCKMGRATLVAGVAVVSTTAVTAASEIFLTYQSLGTIALPAAIGVTARTAGTSFTITSAAPTDTSVVAWHLVEPS